MQPHFCSQIGKESYQVQNLARYVVYVCLFGERISGSLFFATVAVLIAFLCLSLSLSVSLSLSLSLSLLNYIPICCLTFLLLFVQTSSAPDPQSSNSRMLKCCHKGSDWIEFDSHSFLWKSGEWYGIILN